MSLAYDTDFYTWTREQADALARRSTNELDWENLRKEIESLGNEVEHAVESALEVLIHHWLKWLFQPAKRSRSWVLSIEEHRRRVERRLRKNPGLRPQLSELFSEAYKTARLTAALETKKPKEAFPDQPAFTYEFAMNEPIEWEGPEPQRRSRVRKTKA